MEAGKSATVLGIAAAAVMFGTQARATSCGGQAYPFPYTDVAVVGDAFCPGIMEAYVLGVTRGTSPTAFSPGDNVTRLQMTTFLQRSIDQGLRRSSRRHALGQWWSPQESAAAAQTIGLPGDGPVGSCRADGERVWVANGNRIHGIHASTGEVLADVFFAPAITNLASLLVAQGRIYYTDATAQFIIPIQPKRDSPYIFSTSGAFVPYRPARLGFDGIRLWTVNTADGSIARISMLNGTPAPPGVVTGGFTAPVDLAYDGRNMWVVEAGAANRIRKLDASATPLLTVAVGANPSSITFDGANLWVTNSDADSITVVSAGTGGVIATIASDASNALSQPWQSAFDGERILVTNRGNGTVTLFRAADLSLIGSVPVGPASEPYGVCSDGIYFWVTLRGSKELIRL